MFSVGTDMVEINRIKKSMEREGFLHRILGGEEYIQLALKKFPAQSVAGNFCAKEAFSKAVGTGFRGIHLKEIEIIRNKLGKPFMKFNGNALKLYKNDEFSVSITHTKDLALAVVVYLGKDRVYEW